MDAVSLTHGTCVWCVCRFHKIKRKRKEKELRKELESAGGAVEQAEPLLYQRAMVGGWGGKGREGSLSGSTYTHTPCTLHCILYMVRCIRICVCVQVYTYCTCVVCVCVHVSIHTYMCTVHTVGYELGTFSMTM